MPQNRPKTKAYFIHQPPVLCDLQAVPTIVFALLAGAWSDRYGRLFVILIPLASFIIRDVVFIVISLFEVVLLVESTFTTSP